MSEARAAIRSALTAEIIGPMSVPSFIGSPVTIAWVAATKRSRNMA